MAYELKFQLAPQNGRCENTLYPPTTMADLSNEINLITSRLSTKLLTLEADLQRWNDYKTDYDALETQLKTLPDTTSKSAMVCRPIKKLCVHVAEITLIKDPFRKARFYAR